MNTFLLKYHLGREYFFNSDLNGWIILHGLKMVSGKVNCLRRGFHGGLL
jgi:hypothetical protein